jgi:hypothetical protein
MDNTNLQPELNNDQSQPLPSQTPPNPPKGLNNTTQNNSNEAWHGLFNTLNQANLAIKNNVAPYIFYLSILLIVEVALLLLVKLPSSSKFTNQQIAALGDGVITILLIPYLTKYELCLAKGLKTSIGQLFKLSLRTYFNVYLTLIMFIPILIIGALLVLVPLVWILPWFYLVFYPVVDLNYSPIEAFNYVRTIMKNNLGKIWSMLGVYFVVNLLLRILAPNESTFFMSMLQVVFETYAAILYVWLIKKAPATAK